MFDIQYEKYNSRSRMGSCLEPKSLASFTVRYNDRKAMLSWVKLIPWYPLTRPAFLEGWHWGGFTLRFPWCHRCSCIYIDASHVYKYHRCLNMFFAGGLLLFDIPVAETRTSSTLLSRKMCWNGLPRWQMAIRHLGFSRCKPADACINTCWQGKVRA